MTELTTQWLMILKKYKPMFKSGETISISNKCSEVRTNDKVNEAVVKNDNKKRRSWKSTRIKVIKT